MTRIRLVAVIVFVLILLIFLSLLWSRPRKVDMAAYAPANSLVYLESGSLLKIAEELSQTEAWKALDPPVRLNPGDWSNRFISLLVGWTGIGSDLHVLLARAQLAVVMIDLSTSEKGDVLEVKPSAAILVETHMSERRIRPILEKSLGDFARGAYSSTGPVRTSFQDVELLEWKANAGDRRIIAAIDGSLVIIGNDENAVKSCLAVRRGQQLSLINDEELRQMRAQLGAPDALTFGYVPKANSARLLAQTAPLLFGTGPGELELEKFLSGGASKLVGSLGWSSHANSGGIEDRYFFLFNPAFASRLQVPFEAARFSSDVWDVLPTSVRSVTIYNYQEPAAVWANVETAVSSQLDTLSALIVDSLVRGSLLAYGISEPQQFFKTVHPELLTARLSDRTDRSVVIARVRDKPAIEKAIRDGRNAEAMQDSSVAFIGEYLLIGAPEDVRECVRAHEEKTSIPHNGKIRQVTHFALEPSIAGVLTYSDESQRVRGFLQAIAILSGSPSSSIHETDLEDKIAQLPFSASQTTIGDSGLERRTRSSFGQFSNLVPLIIPYNASAKVP